jgi:Prp8 binding protein
MSAEKRPASDAFGSSQLVVKRPNLGNNGKAVAVVNGGGNGALIQAVRAALREPSTLLYTLGASC